MRIGGIEFPQGAGLAPMAGVTDMPMRRLCFEMGAAWAVSEMLSAKGFMYAPKGTRAMDNLLSHDKSEGILGLQLFGREIPYMSAAAERLSDRGFDFIDINMGCPAPKITGPGAGSSISALMRAARSSASPGSGVTCSCGRNTLEPLAVVDNTLSPQANASSTALEQAS